jgi:PAS domain S-box-containing protein
VYSPSGQSPLLKPFRTRGLVRRVTPFIGAGLVALVVFADPNFTRLPWADALAVLIAASTTVAALSPIDWDRPPRLTMAAPLVAGLLLALGSTFNQGSPLPIAAAAVGTLVIVAIYTLPWDRLPRWVHNLPIFGGIAAVFVFQITVQTQPHAIAPVLLVVPLYLTSLLFAALYHTRNEVLAAATLASVVILALGISSGHQPGDVATSILVVALLWVTVLTVHAVVEQKHHDEERLQALNEQVVHQKNLVEEVLQNLSDMGIGLVTSTGSDIESVNEAISRMTGYGRGPGEFPPMADLFAPESKAKLREQLASRPAGVGDVIVQEWEIIARDGRRIPIESISHSEMVDGKPHSVAIILDITARKQVERALTASQARLQAIIDTSLTAIVTMDQRGVITDWNPQAESTFGWPREEIVGKVLADTIIPTQHREAHRAGLARYLATGEGPVLGKVLELTAIARDGHEFPIDLAISPASAPGGEVLFVGFVRDITTRKQAEDSINDLNQELQIANQHKSEFLANMSHELRTPLNAILGFSELMIDDMTGKFDAASRQKFLIQINSSGAHLLALINDILDISKVEAGRMTLTLEKVSIADVVRGVVSSIEPLAAKKHIRISTDVEYAGEIEADAAKLKQMLLNLVANAVKFTPEVGLITIEAERLQSAVEISIADTGIGIAESDLGRLFMEFQQLESGAGRQQEGTGLGLALTKRLAELHGGEVRVSSQVGRGSVFTIKLPLRQSDIPQATPVHPLPKTAAYDARPIVLVVEDNLQAAELLVRQLDHGGFRTEIALGGVEALAKARELRPIAITLDILLPGLDGWDVLEQLKRDAVTRDIPVVVISVVDKPELGRALGAIDYFVKPVDGKALLDRLSQFTFTSKVGTEETRILAVDDEPANLEWLEKVLKPAGFTVVSALGGREGIEQAKSSRPHLVLLDLVMPEVNGFDVVKALHADDSTSAIPIMILTAKDLTDDDKRELNGNVAAILERGSTGATDLVGWLNRLIAARHETR